MYPVKYRGQTPQHWNTKSDQSQCVTCWMIFGVLLVLDFMWWLDGAEALCEGDIVMLYQQACMHFRPETRYTMKHRSQNNSFVPQVKGCVGAVVLQCRVPRSSAEAVLRQEHSRGGNHGWLVLQSFIFQKRQLCQVAAQRLQPADDNFNAELETLVADFSPEEQEKFHEQRAKSMQPLGFSLHNSSLVKGTFTAPRK